MTNIGALKVVQKDKKQYLVFVADGMGSTSRYIHTQNGIIMNPSGGNKYDNAQKLFKVNDFLMMGTGRGDWIQNTALEIAKQNPKTAEETAKKILEITNTFGLTENDGLNFIVGGPNGEGLKLYAVNTTGNTRHIDGQANYQRRGFLEKNFHFDGSGSIHVNAYMAGCEEAGRPLIAQDLADGLSIAFELGRKGAKDIGVNDKLQYGIITPNGISRLYHPEVKPISVESGADYIKEMTGIDIKIPKKMSRKQQIEIGLQVREIGKVLRGIYQAMEADLAIHSAEKRKFEYAMHYWAHDLGPHIAVKEGKKAKTKTKEHIIKAVTALETRGLEAIIKYQEDYDKRQKEARKKAKEYLK